MNGSSMIAKHEFESASFLFKEKEKERYHENYQWVTDDNSLLMGIRSMDSSIKKTAR